MRKIPLYFLLIIFLFLSSGCAGITPLMNAASSGDINAVKDLLDKGAVVDEKGAYESTAMREAAENGHGDIVKLLLDKGADVNAKDAFGETALLSASLKGHTEVVKLLLDRGAKVNTKNYNGWTALAYASKIDIAQLLLGKGADINAKNNHGATVLSSAAMSGRDDVVKLLAERGADVEAALSRCEQTLGEWSKSSNKYLSEKSDEPRHCVELLKKIKYERDEPKRREQEIAKARVIENQKAREMKEIIKEVLAETTRTQKQGAPSPAVDSDIEKPSFAPAERIIGDNDLAIIIGIEGYQNLPKSDYSYDDAKLVKEYARALGFKERNIELITDERATKTTLEKTLEVWLKNKAKSDSRVLVYYSGHGAPDPATGEAYMVPFDGDPNYLAVTGYPLKRLYENLGKLAVAEVTVVLDACFSGSGGRSVIAKGARPLVMSTTAVPVAKTMAVLSATQGAQISTSSPERGHGLFTYYFLKAIKEGKRNVADIYEYLRPLVEDEAKAINVQQSPSVNPDLEKLRGRFVLRK